MAKSYHILQGTNVVGPLQYDELTKLVQKGVVSERTLLSDDASNWKPANELAPQMFGKQSASSGVTSSSSGAEQWYVQSNGQQYGPISYTELLGWVNSKSVVAETLVRKSENGAWQRADTVFPHLGSTSSNAASKGLSASAGSGGDATMTIFAVIGVGVVIFAMVQGLIQFKAAFGFLGIFAVWMLFNLVRGLSSMSRRRK
jgi:hypothetical protein